MYRFAVFDSKPYDKDGLDRFGKEKGVEFKYFETKLSSDTVGLSRGFDGVVVFVNDTVDKPVIDALCENGVKMIALRCAGFNNVDLKAAQDRIKIARVPAYSPYAVAEHTMAMLLTSIRRIHKAYNRTREFNFSLNGFTGFELHGRTVGVIGTGKIGRIFVNICKGFGMKVIAYDAYPDESLDVKYVELDELFKESDIISLHCPLNAQTDHLIDEDSISKMKKGVVIVNTSRGALIDAEALLEAIKSRKVGAACLDVYEEESDVFFEDFSGHIIDDDVLARLLTMPNVLITSHQAFLTEDALENIAETTVNNIVTFMESGKVENEVCYKCKNN